MESPASYAGPPRDILKDVFDSPKFIDSLVIF